MSNMTPEQIDAEIARLKALKKAVLKPSISGTDPDAIEIANSVKAVAEKLKLSTDKVIAAVKEALSGKASGARKQSAINVIRKALKEKGLGPFPVGGEGNEQARAKYAEVFGKDALAQVDAEFPPSPSAKYKK